MVEFIFYLSVPLIISVGSAYLLKKITIGLYKKEVVIKGVVFGVIFVIFYPVVILTTASIFLTCLFYIYSILFDCASVSGVGLGFILIAGFPVLIISWFLSLACIDWWSSQEEDDDSA